MYTDSELKYLRETDKSKKLKLIFWSSGYLLSFFIWVAIVGFIGMAGAPNHGGFGQEILDKIIVFFHLSYPILVMVILIIGWGLYFKGRSDIALKIIFVPLVHGILLILFLFIWFNMNM